MLQRLTISLSRLEQQALETIAAIELRDMRDQARFILRQELERRGLLVIETQANPAPVTALPAEDLKQEQGGTHVTG